MTLPSPLRKSVRVWDGLEGQFWENRVQFSVLPSFIPCIRREKVVEASKPLLPMIRKIPLSLPVPAALVLAASSASATIVFPFDNTAATYRPANFIGWNSYHLNGTTVTDLTATAPDGSTGGANQIGIGSANGVGGTLSYLFSISDGANQRFAAVASVSSPATTSVTWQMGNSTNSTTVRLVVQTAGSWYATQTGYSTAATTLAQFQGTGGSATLVSVDFSTATWFSYDLTTMVVGSTGVALPSNDLTGVGFHIFNSADNAVTRLDNLTLVPEPSAALFGTLAGLGFAIRRRR